MRDVRDITRAEILAKLERGDEFKLAMALDRRLFRERHIPGSLNIPDRAAALALLRRDDEIVVYGWNVACPAGLGACRQLRAAGFTRVARYAGGLDDWTGAGLPVVPI